jgi:hypothetical protein
MQRRTSEFQSILVVVYKKTKSEHFVNTIFYIWRMVRHNFFGGFIVKLVPQCHLDPRTLKLHIQVPKLTKWSLVVQITLINIDHSLLSVFVGVMSPEYMNSSFLLLSGS